MDKKKKDYLSKTLGMQFLICILLFALLFALKNSKNTLFYEFEEMFSEKLSQSISPQEVKDVFGNIISDENTTEAEKDTANAEENTNEKNSTEKTESETEQKSSKNNEEKGEAVRDSETETKKATEKDTEPESEYIPLEEPSLSAEIIAGGGEDIKVTSDDDTPSNVSVDSYALNQKMILPVNGHITSEFGVRTHPISGDLRFHAGIDIAAESGTPVYAAFSGKVITAKYDQWNGNYLKIEHDNEITTVYCHCLKLNVKKGQIIRAGEVVAYVGSTGSSTGPHLHFELRIDNVSYNPQKALEGAINAV